MFLVIAAEAVAAPPTYLTAPIWERKPTGEDLSKLFPVPAMMKNKNGYGVIECKATAAGELADCQVLGEEPAGEGFADATLKIAAKFKMKPLTADGRSVAGGLVRIPMRWRLPGSEPMRGPSLPGTTACYGQVANLAEQKPDQPGAWRATILWTVQFDTLLGAGYARPSEVEFRARQARLAAADGTLEIPKGWDLQACLNEVAKKDTAKK